jgi:hypothetical protein
MNDLLPKDYAKQRAAFRLPMLASDPVHLLFSIDGVNVDPLLDELGAGGGRFVAVRAYDKMYKGQVLGPAVLLLPDIGMPVVYPIVRWMSYPRIGVQFEESSEKNKEMIFRFMFYVERKMVQMQKAATAEDRLR